MSQHFTAAEVDQLTRYPESAQHPLVVDVIRFLASDLQGARAELAKLTRGSRPELDGPFERYCDRCGGYGKRANFYDGMVACEVCGGTGIAPELPTPPTDLTTQPNEQSERTNPMSQKISDEELAALAKQSAKLANYNEIEMGGAARVSQTTLDSLIADLQAARAELVKHRRRWWKRSGILYRTSELRVVEKLDSCQAWHKSVLDEGMMDVMGVPELRGPPAELTDHNEKGA
jgi:uncharacterized Zn finger protein (UPF0148 family)